MTRKEEAMTHMSGRKFNRMLVTAGALAALSVSHAAIAQDGRPVAGIVGTVHDLSGATVTGANLTIRNLSSAQIQSRTSDAFGVFNVQNLAPGSYELTAAKGGFREANTTVVLAANQQAHTDLRLTSAA